MSENGPIRFYATPSLFFSYLSLISSMPKKLKFLMLSDLALSESFWSCLKACKWSEVIRYYEDCGHVRGLLTN